MIRFACDQCGSDMTEEVISCLEGVNAIVGLTDKGKIRRISDYLQDGHGYSAEEPFTRDQYERIRDLGHSLIAYMVYQPTICRKCIGLSPDESRKPIKIHKVRRRANR